MAVVVIWQENAEWLGKGISQEPSMKMEVGDTLDLVKRCVDIPPELRLSRRLPEGDSIIAEAWRRSILQQSTILIRQASPRPVCDPRVTPHILF